MQMNGQSIQHGMSLFDCDQLIKYRIKRGRFYCDVMQDDVTMHFAYGGNLREPSHRFANPHQNFG